MKFKGKFFIIAALLVITSCAPVATELPTSTPTTVAIPLPTATPMNVVNISGTIFFDKNGSGIQEDEPLIPNIEICGKSIDDRWSCVFSDENGSFELKSISIFSDDIFLKLSDPNSDDPKTAYRCINYFHKSVQIDEYVKEGFKVNTQELNETEIILIENILVIPPKENLNIGLMQGFLTLPFPSGYPAFILGYADIDGEKRWQENGRSMNYLGETLDWTRVKPNSSTSSTKIKSQTLVFPGITGTHDAHAGIDYRIELYTPLVASFPGTVYRFHRDNGWNISVSHKIGNSNFSTFYGHVDSKLLVDIDQYVHRGQIIGLSSNTSDKDSGNDFGGILHFSLTRGKQYTPSQDIDPYRNVSNFEFPLASKHSYWTVDNIPQFPLVEIIE